MVTWAICTHGDLSLVVCALNTGVSTDYGNCWDLLLSHQKAFLERRYQVLAKAFWRKLCYGCSNRYYFRIRIWYQLEQLLVVCGRHLWRTISHWRHISFLHGVDFRCRDVLWLEESVTRFPLGFYMVDRTWRHTLCLVDFSSQCMDAISRGANVQSRHDALWNEFVFRCGFITICRWKVLPHGDFLMDYRCSFRSRSLFMVSAQTQRATISCKQFEGGYHRWFSCFALSSSHRPWLCLPSSTDTTYEISRDGSTLSRRKSTKPIDNGWCFALPTARLSTPAGTTF